MAKNSSFDVVSEVDMQEVDNAINQATKEIMQRYDLKDSHTEIELDKKEKTISITSKDDFSLKSCIDIIQSKFFKRQISLKSMKMGTIEQTSKGHVKQKIELQAGISKENGKLITKLVKDSKLKVTAQIMDEIVRIQGANKDDLQEVIKLIRESDFDFPTQFTNYK